ncbi:threonine ammonia-lyase, biosynthetic [Echinimonas agarilytica]|uniref:L-threonine dehydratase n=1 Tax=Echinimonas agarilytica TaxID=1215918 RepID=A0AA41W449_9GAMM|nr:threonine ammonia-lyase, biosynthetic [Echinimonas agarilytica]MCM2678208.1 threonine ammonia-lyase, biosynthetic [Echinimonas agarilytica]
MAQPTPLNPQPTHPTDSEYLRKILLAPIYDLAKVTPLQPMKKLSERLGCDVVLKREDMQPVHSFKLRGAYNKLLSLTNEQRARGVVAASAGNHAQGLAMSAAKLGVNATIVMPTTTPDIKVDAVRRLGGNVVQVGDNFDAASAESRRLAAEQGMTLVPPFDDVEVITGQGTCGMEMLQQSQKLNAVFLPVGGGGLAAGVAVYLRQLRPDIKLIGVEAEDSACLAEAWKHGKPSDLSNVGLFADGVAVKRIGEETFRLCYQHLDDVITVSTDEICAAIKDAFDDMRAISEPAGALSIAGLKKYAQQNDVAGLQLGAILSGANLNFHTLRYVSERTELGEGKEAVLAVTIPERKGSFRQFCETLQGRAITEFNYRFADNASANIFVGVRVEDESARLALITELEDKGYATHDLTNNELAKLHIRYMVGGHPHRSIPEKLLGFEFPEHPGALLKFLNTLGEQWNITLFHYRNHGAAYGRVFAGFEVPETDNDAFHGFLEQVGYEYHDETNNPAYTAFLK